MKKTFGADWDRRKKDVFFWSAVGFVVITAIWVNYGSGATGDGEFARSEPYSTFVRQVKAGEVTKVSLSKGNNGTDRLLVTRKDKTKYSVVYPVYEANVTGLMIDEEVEYEVIPRQSPSSFLATLIQIASLLMFGGLLYFIIKSTRMFDKSHVKRFDSKNQQVMKFADVAGVDEAKENLTEIVSFLKNPAKFASFGGRVPKGVLLFGEPGTGKTLLARAVAGEADVPFFSLSGADFVEMYVGVGVMRVKSLFAEAKKNAPCIVFIDEIDSMGRTRAGTNSDSASEERSSTLNRFLVEMDGFSGETGVVIIAATNKPEILDPALMRSGRFDRKVYVSKPDVRGREAILAVHARRFKVATDITLSAIARGTIGFSGADLENLLNESSFLAIRRGHRYIEAQDIDTAKDKIIFGDERRGFFASMSEKSRRETAYHEAGHAVVAHHHDASEPLHKITIVPHGRALGITSQLPVEDRYVMDQAYLNARLAVLMGGAAAERIFLNRPTSGVANDFQEATRLARNMVCLWGMSSLGPIAIESETGQISAARAFSDATLREVDTLVMALLNDAYKVAEDCLKNHKHQVERLVDSLMEAETLDSRQIQILLTPQHFN